ncbi:MAG: NAD(P)/FAD-dependent oxidoreductase, partial [Sciscionella sp.]
TLIGAETEQPYDRPPLSKGFLLGTAGPEELALLDEGDRAELSARWRLGVPARRLDPASGRVELEDGSSVQADGVVIATGAAPITLSGAVGIDGVHTLRSLPDARRLSAELTAGPRRVLIVGAGFLGAEVASSAHSLGHEVCLVDSSPEPLSAVLGRRIALRCTELHRAHGVALRTGVGIEEVHSTRRGGRHILTGVRMTDGSHHEADVMVVGIGVRPATGWLRQGPLDCGNGVHCDAGCVSAIPSVVAVGDVAARHDPVSGMRNRGEHWSNATEQAAVATRNLLAGRTAEHYRPTGYFWSEQYGSRIQFAGTTTHADELAVQAGELDSDSFVVDYLRYGSRIGVLALNNPKLFTRTRRTLATVDTVAVG